MSEEVVEIVGHLALSRPDQRLLVAVDGVDGSGKTTFAETLVDQLRSYGRKAVVVHVDDFMNLTSIRHRKGRESPEGYVHDSYDYDSLTRYVLDPLSPDGDGWFRPGIVDRVGDVARQQPLEYSAPGTVTIVEGLFLLRDELVNWWDYSIFLAVDTETSLARKSRRDGLVLDSTNPLTRRYVEGQRAYLSSCRPHERATWVLDNTDRTTPHLP
jgi:uridine kinase